jgi:hypothetical protein
MSKTERSEEDDMKENSQTLDPVVVVLVQGVLPCVCVFFHYFQILFYCPLEVVN